MIAQYHGPKPPITHLNQAIFVIRRSTKPHCSDLCSERIEQFLHAANAFRIFRTFSRQNPEKHVGHVYFDLFKQVKKFLVV